MSLLKSTQRFLQDDSGPTAVEYAVMLALILVVIIAGVNAVGGGNNGWWARTNTEFSTYGF